MKNFPKWILVLLVIGILAVFFFMTQRMKTQEQTYSFDADVLAVMEDRILVDVTSGDLSKGEAELLTGGEYEFPQLKAGDKIHVVFDGISTRSLPPQIPGVSEIDKYCLSE